MAGYIQPIDVSIYSPFKATYKQECKLFLKTESRRKITQNDNASYFKKCFQKVATIPKAEPRFSTAGIYPLNPDILTDEDFLTAEILNTNKISISTKKNWHKNF